MLAATSSPADDLKKVAAAIDGYRYEFPCKDPMPENPKPGADGISARATTDPATNDKFTDVRKFGGEPGKRYRSLPPRPRRGRADDLQEDGQMVGDYFQIGGAPNNATYNIYQLTVSSPASHYFDRRTRSVTASSLSTTPRPSRSKAAPRSPSTAMGRTVE